jgi:hypothetical protein
VTSESTHDIRVISSHATPVIVLLVKVEGEAVLAKELGQVIVK